MKCAKCGAEIDPSERFCGECGQPVHVSAAPPTPAGQVLVATCPKCSANVDPGERFCSSCGYDLVTVALKPQAEVTHSVAPAQPVPAATRTSSSSFRIALIFGAAVMVLILVFGSVLGLWMWFGGRAEEANENRGPATTSIAGTWNCVFTAPGETERGSMTLTQNGSAITGTLATEGDIDQIAGNFDGQKFAFQVPNTEFEWQLALSPDGSSMNGEVQYDAERGTLACTR